jgi:hypothetical protein
MVYVPSILAAGALVLIPFITHPLLLVCVILVWAALGFTGEYRIAWVGVPVMIFAAEFAHVGDFILAHFAPVLLQRPVWVGDIPYWRPGLIAIFVLLAIGASLGWLIKKYWLGPWWEELLEPRS